MGEDEPRGDESLANWNAANIYTCGLQNIDNNANEVKYSIEMRDGTAEEMSNYFKMYLAKLRALFRELYFFFKGDEKKKIQTKILELRNVLDNLTGKDIRSSGFPVGIEDDMEELHNMLNERRFARGLIVPMGLAPDSSGIEGWENPGG